ncbi:hypothetical protein LYZ98_10855, partial [Xanthomonas hortorum pv. vitians]|nr:hypothetical protein [Xanthomonas hortorum pv. vitians]
RTSHQEVGRLPDINLPVARLAMRRFSDATLSEQRTNALLAIMHTDILDWSLPAHRRGTLRGMDAA